MKNIEVELRSFISKERYEELLSYFKEKANFLEGDFQETHYLSGEKDLRIQKNKKGSKIWMKKGKIHDDAREEIEIFTSRENFEDLGKLFENLGHRTEIKWMRDRKEFDWKGIKVSLDYTKGYGYIIEMEKMSEESEKEKVLEELKQKFNEMKIQITPREEFEKAYNNYKENWRDLVENDMD